jgi:hypothetical protein
VTARHAGAHAPATAGLITLVATLSCSPAVDRAAVAAVQVSGARDPPAGCRLLGPLEGRDSNRWVPGGPRYETVMLYLREKAVLGGGNHLQIDAIVPPRDEDYNPVFIVRARLYACNPGSAHAINAADARPVAASASPTPAVVASPSATPASASRVCEPECSPGYVCVRGSCVSACNPLCAAGERCGVDRICHPVSALAPPASVSP